MSLLQDTKTPVEAKLDVFYTSRTSSGTPEKAQTKSAVIVQKIECGHDLPKGDEPRVGFSDL